MVCNNPTMGVDVYFGDEVKSDRLGFVKGYLVRFGDEKATDLEGDYFTNQTDFGFPAKASNRVPLNLYYHHGMDPAVGRKAIGTGFVKMTDEGLWYEAQIDMADEYGKMIARLAKAGKLGFSSGSAGHMVERESKGIAHQITRWPIAEASVTPTPAEPRNVAKSLGEMYGMMDGEGEDMGEMEMPELDVNATPDDYVAQAFGDIKLDIIHEGLESLFDALCAGIMGLAAMDGDRASYAAALVRGFADRALGMVDGLAMDAKSLATVKPDTLRSTERRLRDAIGCSRSDAKRLAPLVWDALRDAPATTTDTSDDHAAKAAIREDILARIDLLIGMQNDH